MASEKERGMDFVKNVDKDLNRIRSLREAPIAWGFLAVSFAVQATILLSLFPFSIRFYRKKIGDPPMRNHKSLSFSRFALLPLALGMGFLFSCAGHERAPHQPVKGVDTEKNEVKNPYDKMSVRSDPGTPKHISSSVSQPMSSQGEQNKGQRNEGGEESGQDAFAFLDTFRQTTR
jgi:hypothetical protein